MSNDRNTVTAFGTLLLLLILTVTGCTDRREKNGDASTALTALSGTDTAGYARAYEPRKFTFPADDGPHPGFKTEWWYWTGNLFTGEGRRFGYQFTVFRNALAPDTVTHSSPWRDSQLYFAHLAISDIQTEKFYAFERFSRGTPALAGAQAYPFRVWVEDWVAEGRSDSVHIIAGDDNSKLDLALLSSGPPVLQGNDGLSQKSAAAGNASYYYSRTRLVTTGRVKVDGESFNVRGSSWLDREWSTSVLAEEQQGWDWFALQFDDDSELMLYQLRLRDGAIDSLSSGMIVEADGRTRTLSTDDFRIEPTGTWTSPESGIRWPSGWLLHVHPWEATLRVTPAQKNQEMPLSIRYWEGAVDVSGGSKRGVGYVELTGYGTE